MLVRLADVAPIASAFWRMALAAPVVLVVAEAKAPGALRRAPKGPAALAGACFALDLAAWHLGIVRTTTANATLFANTTAFLLAAWGLVVVGERFDRHRHGPLLLAGAGAALLLWRSAELSNRHLAGDLLSLLAAAFYTGYMLAIVRLRATTPTLPALALATLFAALFLGPLAWAEGGPVWPRAWGPVVALAASSQLLGQGLVVFASGRLAPSLLALGLLVQPLVSAAAGFLVFDERPGWPELVGAGLILAAFLWVRL